MFSKIDNLIKSSTISGEAFFVTSSNGSCDVFRVSLEPGAEKDLTESYGESLLKNVVQPNSGASSVPLVSALSDRAKQVFEFDHVNIGYLPPEFTAMSQVLSLGINSSPKQFDFKKMSMTDVKGIIYHISDASGNRVVVYQHKHSIYLHKKTARSYVSLNGRTLDEVKYDVIDINGTVDFFLFNGVYYAINIPLLERSYGLEQVIDNLVAIATPSVINLNLIEVSGLANPMDIFKDMHKDRRFMRRLASIANSSLVKSGAINMTMVQSVMKDFPVFSRELKINSKGLIELSTKEQKRFFIRLLNNEASFTALDKEPFLAVGKDSAS